MFPLLYWIGKSSPNNLKKKVKGSELPFRRYAHFGKPTLTLRAVPRNALGRELPTVRMGRAEGVNIESLMVLFCESSLDDIVKFLKHTNLFGKL